MVPRVGLEPTLREEPDFESGASTNSATEAWCVKKPHHKHETISVNPLMHGLAFFITYAHFKGMSFVTQLRFLLLIGGIVPLAAALVSQYGFGLHPCEMCLYQRVPYALVAALSLYAWLKPDLTKLRNILLICIILWFIEGVLAFYHVGIEQAWWESATGCTSGGETGQSLDELKKAIMNSPVVSCSDVAFRFLGLSMAAWNVIASLGLIVAGMVLRKRSAS